MMVYGHEVKMTCWNVYMVACLYIAIVTSIHADCFTYLYADIIAVFRYAVYESRQVKSIEESNPEH